MVTKTIKTLFFLVCALLLTLLLCQMRNDKQQEFKRERSEAGIRVASLMRSHDFRHLYPYLDSLQKAFPHDPQFYETEGMARYYQGDRARANQAFTKAIEKYDYLISTKHIFSARVYRATLILLKDGKMAYYLALDEALTHAKTQQQEQEVKIYRGMDCADILKLSFGEPVVLKETVE